jgi:putative tryptophan/tyrosine transport system substrate-binding protein
MRRREFIAGLGAAAWPVVARAQQAERMHRIGLLMGLVESDPEAQSRITMLRQSLRELGWTEGRNLLIDYRWGASDPDRYRTYAAQLVALAPDVVVTENGNIVRFFRTGVPRREDSVRGDE